MSFDLEYNNMSTKPNGITQPLLTKNMVNQGSSPTEIQDNLVKVSKNISTLSTYAKNLGRGKMNKQEHSSMNRMLNETSLAFRKVGELLENYK
jgi:hypothetical protein